MPNEYGLRRWLETQAGLGYAPGHVTRRHQTRTTLCPTSPGFSATACGSKTRAVSKKGSGKRRYERQKAQNRRTYGGTASQRWDRSHPRNEGRGMTYSRPGRARGRHHKTRSTKSKKRPAAGPSGGTKKKPRTAPYRRMSRAEKRDFEHTVLGLKRRKPGSG